MKYLLTCNYGTEERRCTFNDKYVILFGLEIPHFSDISGRPVNRTMSTVYCAIVIELKNRH